MLAEIATHAHVCAFTDASDEALDTHHTDANCRQACIAKDAHCRKMPRAVFRQCVPQDIRRSVRHTDDDSEQDHEIRCLIRLLHPLPPHTTHLQTGVAKPRLTQGRSNDSAQAVP